VAREGDDTQIANGPAVPRATDLAA